jgi:hypothetical protein
LVQPEKYVHQPRALVAGLSFLTIFVAREIRAFNMGPDDMRILIYILFGIGAFLLVPVGTVGWFFLSGGIFGECGTQEIVRKNSPSNKYEVIVYTKDCGATTSIATIVGLRQGGSANTFEDIVAVDVIGGIFVDWLSPDRLSVSLPVRESSPDIFGKEEHWQAVSIEYVYR